MPCGGNLCMIFFDGGKWRYQVDGSLRAAFFPGGNPPCDSAGFMLYCSMGRQKKKKGDAMELNMMRQFLAMAEEKNMRRASEKIYISQSALSQTLKKLEQELDVPLFRREKEGLVLTEYGTLFYGYARKTLDIVTECTQAIQARKMARKELRVVTDNDYILSFVTPVFMSAKEGIKLRIRFAKTDEISDIRRSGDFDIIIAEQGFQGEPDVVSSLLTRYRLFCSVPKSNPIASRPKVLLKELEGQEFIRGRRPIKETARLDHYIEKNHIHLDVKHYTDRDGARIFEKRSNYLILECSYKLISLDPISPHRTLVEVVDPEITGYPLYMTYRKANRGDQTLQCFIDWIQDFLLKNNAVSLLHEDVE